MYERSYGRVSHYYLSIGAHSNPPLCLKFGLRTGEQSNFTSSENSNRRFLKPYEARSPLSLFQQASQETEVSDDDTDNEQNHHV
jgi:hypothetical protein